MKHIGIFIVNYNMPERTDALCEHITERVKGCSFDLIVVDNGSHMRWPSAFTTLTLEKNVQTCNGWLMGLHYADALKAMYGRDYFAYWFIITSAEFPSWGNPNSDPLAPLVALLEDVPDAVGVHPALTQDSTTMWDHMKLPPLGEVYLPDPRPVHMIDNIASLYRADWFDSIGRFDPELVYAHGIDLETCWIARHQGKSLWVHQGSAIKKVTDVGYKMGRMGMSARKRNQLAQENMNRVLIPRYGPDYWEVLLHDR